MAPFRNSASDAGSHPVLTQYQSDLHRFAQQAAIRIEEDRQVALRQDGQELPETLGGTLIKSALPGDPLAAASPARVWLTRGNHKNHWLASDLCEYALELFGIVARSNRNRRKAAKRRRHTPHKFANHNTTSCRGPTILLCLHRSPLARRRPLFYSRLANCHAAEFREGLQQ